MEFWGVEVKPGESLKVHPEFGKLIHISQASLGEIKDVKGAKSVPLRMKIDSKEFVVGTLAAGDRPQVMFDLVIEKEFELSHDCKSGSVYFMGYICDDPVSDDDVSDFDAESEDEALEAHENGDIKPKIEDLKAANPNVKAELKKEVKAEVKKEVKAEVKNEEQPDSGSSSDDEDDSDSGSDGDIPLNGELDGDSSGDDMSDDSDDEDSSDEELPQVQLSKKRPAQGTPIPAKKAKADNKTGNKKGHTATPFPAKQGGKFAGGNKQSPKSGGQFSGNKSFSKSNNKGRRGGK